MPKPPTTPQPLTSSYLPRVPKLPTTPYAGERWETFVTMIYADAEQHADFLADHWPDIAFPRFAVQALIPQLDTFGAQGREPVSIQPVNVGSNGDIVMPGYGVGYSNQYLCVFKRRKT